MIPDQPSGKTAGFAALVRTTGSRPLLLLDALQSLALQSATCLPIVIVHGDDAAYDTVQRICADSAAALRVVVLHAAEPRRRRGYPVNVGIEYCLTQCPEVEFVFLLDDDDVVYPFFTSTMAAAFLASGADVVYAASNRREPGRPAAAGYFPRPIHHLVRRNFIASNSYSIRADALRHSGLRMSEEMEYTEDWHFLIRMLQAGFRFHALPATLSEFRTVSDGNLTGKRDPALWQAISLDLRRYINTNTFPLPGPELVRMSSPAGAHSGAAAPPPAMPPEPPASQELVARLVDQEAVIAVLRHRLWTLENSLSWRWTAPVRRLLGALAGTHPDKKPGA